MAGEGLVQRVREALPLGGGERRRDYFAAAAMDDRQFEAPKIGIISAVQRNAIERDWCRACRHPPAAPLDAQRPSFNADMLALSSGAPARPESNAEQG